jgi:preprotein translocase subunit YajC
VLLLLFAYLVLIRPARRRAKETQLLQTALSPGDEVMLTSGIFGRLVSVLDDRFTIEISPGVVVTVHRGAIGKIVRDVPADDEVSDDDDGSDLADDSDGDDSDGDDGPDRLGSGPTGSSSTGSSVIIDTTADDDNDRRRGVV